MVFKDFEVCIKPEPNTVIWRYMSLGKFESLLRTKSLFFCRADRFSDPYEGSITRIEAEYRIKEQKNIANFYGTKFNPQKAEENVNDLAEIHKLFKKQHVINCWHINNSENDSMWRLYLKSNEGIAIKTTIERLLESLSDSTEEIFCSKIRYLDYENDIWYNEHEYPFGSYNLFIPLVHKRMEFKQEAEIRLIHKIGEFREQETNNYWKQQPTQKGKFINVDIEQLIETIYCPPTGDSDHVNEIQKLVSKYNLKFEIKKSTLTKEPYY